MAPQAAPPHLHGRRRHIGVARSATATPRTPDRRTHRCKFNTARGPLDPLTTAVLDQPPSRAAKRLAPPGRLKRYLNKAHLGGARRDRCGFLSEECGFKPKDLNANCVKLRLQESLMVASGRSINTARQTAHRGSRLRAMSKDSSVFIWARLWLWLHLCGSGLVRHLYCQSHNWPSSQRRIWSL